MSNQKFTVVVRTSFAAITSCVFLLLTVNDGLAQSEGFSIFEPAPEVASEATAATVSPREAFTNPKAALPKSQFGSFGNPNTNSRPTLQGSKAVGTYADARSAAGTLAQTPTRTPVSQGALKPYAGNSLRPSQQTQAKTTPIATPIASVEAAPIRSDDFPPSARRLSASPENRAAAETADQTPRVAQVAFQDGGRFNPQVTQGSSSAANRFSQGATTQGATSNRFNFGNNSAQPPAPAVAAAATTQTQPRRSFGQPPAGSGQAASGQQPRRSFPAAQPDNSDRSTQTPPRNQSQQSGFQSTRGQGGRSQFPNANQQTRQQNPRSEARTQPNQRQPNQRQPNGLAANSQSKPKTDPTSAKELLNAWVAVDAENKIPGKQMKLYQFLGQPINGSKKDAINQYWVTFSDLARYRLALQQTEWLNAISKPRQQADQAILAAAQQAAQNRVLHSEIQLAKSQSILGDFMPSMQQNGKLVAVIPANIPWVGKLNTNFDEYTRKGMVPTRFGTIDDYLPKARTLISGEAEAVVASAKAADQARSAMKSGQISIGSVLEAVRIKQQNEEEFLAAVLGYNRAITDYVLSVRQDIYQPKQLASVLIGRNSVQPTLAKANTKQSSPEEDFDSLDSGNDSSGNDSAYQNQRTARRSSNQNSSSGRNSPFQQSSSRSAPTRSNPQSQSTQRASATGFEYGPTASSAKAANFDPASVETERPIQQIRPTSNSEAYGSNQPTAGASRARPAPRTANPRGNFNGGAATGRPADSAPRIPTGGFNGASATPPQNPMAGRQASAAASGGGFSGANGLSQPKVGTFSGAAAPVQPASTASGLGTPGFQTRR